MKIFFPPALAVEGMKSVPVSALTAEPFDVQTQIFRYTWNMLEVLEGLLDKNTDKEGT